MATVQKLTASSLSTANSYGACTVGIVVPDKFPVGLRVLVVDDDPACLKILEHMLRRCLYQVTTCCQAKSALSLLREKKGGYDVVISDVHMPDMDGFKLLELVGLEMDLPVIMMSADGRTSAVMNGIKHGACDYLIKPVRLEELKNIWQHVVRKKWNENKELEHSGSVEDADRHRRLGDDAEYASSVNEGTDASWKVHKRRNDTKEDEDDGELDNDDPSTSKKPRVVWSVELHQQFVSAVNQLGIDKAVPKRILELMNVPGLTRENVASHLQALPQHQQQQSTLPESSHTINVQPSCLVVPSSTNGFQSGGIPVPINQSSGFINTTIAVNYSTLPSQSNNISLGGGQVPDEDFKNVGVLNGYSIQDTSICSSLSSTSVCAESSTGWRVQTPAMTINPPSSLSRLMSNICEIPDSYGTKAGIVTDQGRGRNLGFVGKGMSIPSPSARVFFFFARIVFFFFAVVFFFFILFAGSSTSLQGSSSSLL